MNWEAMGWGVLSAITTLALYKFMGPEYALSNVAYLVTYEATRRRPLHNSQQR